MDSLRQLDRQFTKEFKWQLAQEQGFSGLLIGTLGAIIGPFFITGIALSGFKAWRAGNLGFFKGVAGVVVLYQLVKMTLATGISAWNDILATWSVEKRLDHEFKNMDEELSSEWTKQRTQRGTIDRIMTSIRNALQKTLKAQGIPLST